MRQIILVVLGFSATFLSAQTERFKLMTYNLMYYKSPAPPCSHNVSSSARDAAFKTVFKHSSPQILVVNELGAYPDNSGATYVLNTIINTDGEQNFTSAAYSNDGSSSIVNQIFFDSTLFALRSQDAITNELGGPKLVRVIDVYRLYYKDPGLKLGADTVFFNVIAAHLKASQGQSNVDNREDAAQAIMHYITTQISDENVILAGDLNLYGASEGAWQELTNYSTASARLVDPVNMAGSWNNNGSYALVHTQSTHSSSSGCFSGGGMDDRFDFILHSQAIKNNTDKMSYRQGTYTIVGQDGQHFNQSVNNGTNYSVPSNVANALYDFSDHLPVLAEYEIIASGIGLAETALQHSISYNNPVGDQLKLTKRSASSGDIAIEVYSLTGKLMYRHRWLSGPLQFEVSTASWPNGIYLISLTDPSGQSITKKLVKHNYAR